jgi:hypothetical protein
MKRNSTGCDYTQKYNEIYLVNSPGGSGVEGSQLPPWADLENITSVRVCVWSYHEDSFMVSTALPYKKFYRGDVVRNFEI